MKYGLKTPVLFLCFQNVSAFVRTRDVYNGLFIIRAQSWELIGYFFNDALVSTDDKVAFVNMTAH